jgi:hypothetical protein
MGGISNWCRPGSTLRSPSQAFQHRCPMSRPLFMGLCALVLLGLIVNSAPRAHAVLPGESVDLRTDPELRVLVSGTFLQPTAPDVIQSLRDQTKLPLSLDHSVIADRPLQGFTRFAEIPAWGAMEQLAANAFVQGQWRKVAGEYRLFSHYRGTPPAIPSPVPAEIAARILAESPLASASPGAPDHRERPVILAVVLAVLLLFLVVALQVRRSIQGLGATKSKTGSEISSNDSR